MSVTSKAITSATAGAAFFLQVLAPSTGLAQSAEDVQRDTAAVRIDYYGCLDKNFPTKMGFVQAIEQCLHHLPKGSVVAVVDGNHDLVAHTPGKVSTREPFILPSPTAFGVCANGAATHGPQPVTMDLLKAVVANCSKHLPEGLSAEVVEFQSQPRIKLNRAGDMPKQ